MASLGSNIIANLVGRSWTTLLGIICIPLYLKFLGIEAYGLVGFFATLHGLLGLLDLGIGATLNREIARLSVSADSAVNQRDLVRTLESIYWGIAIVVGGTVYFLAPFIAESWIQAQDLSPDTVLLAVRLMSVAVALQFPFSLYQGGLMGLQRQVLVNIILVVTGTIRSVGALLVLWVVSPTIEAFFVWQVISGLVGSVIFLVAMWRCLPKSVAFPCFRCDILQNVWKYAAAISANALIGVVLTQLDKVILSKMLTLKMFACYSIASTVSAAIWALIIPFNSALFPRFVQLNECDKKEELRLLLHRSSQILSFVLLPVASILIIFSREILLIWTHDAVIADNAWAITSLLVVGTTINGITSIPAYAASAFGWPKLITATNLIQAIIIVPLIVVLTFWVQGVGAALAWVILNCTFLFFMVPRFFKRYLVEEKMSWYLNDELFPSIAAFSATFFLASVIKEARISVTPLYQIVLVWILASFATGLTMRNVRLLISKWLKACLISASVKK